MDGSLAELDIFFSGAGFEWLRRLIYLQFGINLEALSIAAMT